MLFAFDGTMVMTNRFFTIAAPVALLALGACAQPFKADVARFQALPAPNGESFTIQASDPKLQGGLEFSQYAALVSQRLSEQGYRPASSASDATLLVTLDYDVDNGRERIRSSPGGGFGFGYADYGFYRPYYGRYHPFGFRYGFHDPFFGGGYGQIDSYTIYSSELEMQIERTANGERVFEGTAKAISSDDDLTYLVPNLVEAMFTGFPGNSGETVRITIAPEKN
jgi:hypothetical protein